MTSIPRLDILDVVVNGGEAILVRQCAPRSVSYPLGIVECDMVLVDRDSDGELVGAILWHAR